MCERCWSTSGHVLPELLRACPCWLTTSINENVESSTRSGGTATLNLCYVCCASCWALVQTKSLNSWLVPLGIPDRCTWICVRSFLFKHPGWGEEGAIQWGEANQQRRHAWANVHWRNHGKAQRCGAVGASVHDIIILSTLKRRLQAMI